MKVSNMTSSRGNKIANQFIIETTEKLYNKYEKKYQPFRVQYFQSYKSIIAKKIYGKPGYILDSYYWDYSTTTGKYRNQFLNETKKETQAKIDSGEYKLVNLN